MNLIIWLNFIMFAVFTLFFCYQYFYVFVSLVKKPARYIAKKNHKFAVLISARNEENVIGELIESIHSQNYPEELVDIYVVADNCTDSTADVARRGGARVYERNDTTHVGKGYAINFILKKIYTEYAYEKYEGFIVFDADNILDRNYIKEMNAVFDSGYGIVTSYRNSKNYDSNWISAASSLWFLREARYLNNSRMILGNSCAISGTGFLISDKIIRKNKGWRYYLLTEDIEFTISNVINGETVGYADKAVIYDEQPTKLSQSFRQRSRWAKGFYQVFLKYGAKLFKSIFKSKRFSNYDMLVTIGPLTLFTVVTFIVDLIAFAFAGAVGDPAFAKLGQLLLQALFGFYGMFFLMGLITLITEWDYICCKGYKKIMYLFSFPLFMFTYIPVSIYALFFKIEWKPIMHAPVANPAMTDFILQNKGAGHEK